MNYENFKKVLNALNKIDTFIDQANELGIDLFETDIYDGIMTLECELLTNAYTKEGYEWVTWYLYELPNLKKNGSDECHAWDNDNNPIVLDTDRDLWLFLEKNYVNGED